MEHNKERRFVCRYCSKRFPCGKSLGGHIRTHMNNENSADSDEDEPDKLKLDDNNGQSSYGLRENPKKNKRFVDQRELMGHKQQQEHLQCCRECGKGFISLKALCGHMASHSEREKILMEEEEEEEDSHESDDSEASSSPIRQRISKRPVKQHHFRPATIVVNDNKMVQSNSTSFVSSIEQEQEETALSLMMLSRDSTFKKSHNNLLNSLAESSDNNSVILETKSSSEEQLKIMNLKNAAELYKKTHEELRASKLKLRSPEQHNNGFVYDSDNSDSGYFRNGPKKTDSDGSVDGFLKTETGTRTEFRKEWFKEGGSGSGSGSGRSSTKYDLRKSRKIFASSSKKRFKYEFTETVYDSGEQSLETYSCADTELKRYNGSKGATMVVKKGGGGGGSKKKSKGHECPICLRVFKSGQALGGHKRSHFIGNQEHRTVVIQHQVTTEMHTTLIDLNLPAPVE